MFRARPMSLDLVDLPIFFPYFRIDFWNYQRLTVLGFVIVILQVRDFIISDLSCHGRVHYTSPFLMNSYVIKLMEITKKSSSSL